MITDYDIPKEKKDIFLKYLEMINVFDGICKKNNLQYFIGFGTLLGAIRHKGFIPWDDDVDITMKRAEYDKLLSLSKESIPEGYSLQTTLNDKGYYKYVARFRDNNTTFISANDCLMLKNGIIPPYNMGMCLSIFPLDYRPESRIKLWWQYKTGSLRNKILSSYCYGMRKSIRAKLAYGYCSIIDYKKIYCRLVNSYAKYNKRPTKYLQIPGVFYGKSNHFKAIDFSKSIDVEFESLILPAPIGFDSILKTHYGDYMTPPPENARNTHNHAEIVDPNLSYRDYIDNKMHIK